MRTHNTCGTQHAYTHESRVDQRRTHLPTLTLTHTLAQTCGMHTLSLVDREQVEYARTLPALRTHTIGGCENGGR